MPRALFTAMPNETYVRFPHGLRRCQREPAVASGTLNRAGLAVRQVPHGGNDYLRPGALQATGLSLSPRSTGGRQRVVKCVQRSLSSCLDQEEQVNTSISTRGFSHASCWIKARCSALS
ncbi:Protein of unknown function [Pyronema omphalodes CBS 100304]|uniref:Uncharacterized protein n=1 Tax=Pyronema omphalodes (strain CBS 100304) TaxID=1076935 RepID=U4LJ83_PYROM|nr:Protein of unknown function [Pyronema omphalodes CBS 100304]